MKNINILKDLKTLSKLHAPSVESHTTNNGIVDFTCDNAGYVDNVVIEGKTLVNLFSFKKTENSNNNSVWVHINTDYISLFKEVEYTLINTSDKNILVDIYSNDTNSYKRNLLIKANSSIKDTLTSNEHYSKCTGLFSDSWNLSDLSVISSTLIILEGNHTDKPISYFEGLKSVGQGDNIEVLSYKRGSENLASNLTFTEGKYVVSITGEIDNHVEFKYSNEYIEVEGGCEYLFDNINGQFAIYDSSKKIIPLRWQSLKGDWFKGNDYQATFIYAMPKNAKYVRINLPISNLKPYSLIRAKSDKKQISTTLRSLPNGVKDTIEKRGNKYVKVQRCGEVVLNGSEINWVADTNADSNGNRFCECWSYTTLIKSKSFLVCDTLKCRLDIDSDKISVSTHNQGIMITQDSRIRIKNEHSNSVDSLKTWLKSNPITIVYELATPIITELPNFNPQTYKGENTLIMNSGVIQCDASFDMCEGIRSELDVIKNKVSSLDDNVVEVYKPQLLNGFENLYHEDDIYIRKCDSVVSINLRLTNKGTVSDGTLVFKLPGNFSPVSRIGSSIHNGLTGAFTGALIIRNGGEVVLYNSTDLSDIRLNIVYMAR